MRARGMRDGLDVVTPPSIRRTPPEAISPRMKSLSYANLTAGDQEVQSLKPAAKGFRTLRLSGKHQGQGEPGTKARTSDRYEIPSVIQTHPAENARDQVRAAAALAGPRLPREGDQGFACRPVMLEDRSNKPSGSAETPAATILNGNWKASIPDLRFAVSQALALQIISLRDWVGGASTLRMLAVVRLVSLLPSIRQRWGVSVKSTCGKGLVS
jgi:hypothetical protein